MTNLDSVLKHRDITLPTKVHILKDMVFSVVMHGCESLTIKAEHQRTYVFELWYWRRVLRVLWTARKSNQSILKEIKPWIYTGGTDAEAEVPILWPPDVNSWLIRKDPDVGKVWRQEEKGTTEDEMVGWHHWLNGDEFEQALGDGEGQGSLVCCSPGGHKQSDTTERLNNNNNSIYFIWLWGLNEFNKSHLEQSLTQGTWVWAISGSWWRGKPGVLQSMGSHRVRHNWVTDLNWTQSWYMIAVTSLPFSYQMSGVSDYTIFL